MKVLDNGHLEVVDSMGNDLTTVNAARVSMGKSSDEFSEKDAKLIKYLAEHNHTSPFRHSFISFRWKAPISVQRQVFTHHQGISSNSESSRYIEINEEFYVPEIMRSQSKNNKQGSGEPLDTISHILSKCMYLKACETSFQQYTKMLDYGVAREQARDVLPMCTYVSWYWTASLQAIAHFINLRSGEGSQWEINQYADAMKILTHELFPISLEALLK